MKRRIQRIHFVGIGGIGMCGIAELLLNQGYAITGSDLREGPTVKRLRNLGTTVHIGHAADHLGAADVIVYSSAIRPDNPELEEAEKRKIPVIRRAEMLAEIMRMKDGIAVAGSHGKTTTTSLIAHVLDAAGLDPTAIIGGRVLGGTGDPTGARLGRSEILVAEADESDGSFLRLAPVLAVITNIDPEHLDHYGSIEAIEDAFVEFANGLPFWGQVAVFVDHPGIQSILPRITRRVTTYGFSKEADLMAFDLETDGFGMRFRVRDGDRERGPLRIRLPGQHNVANALATLVIAKELGIEFDTAATALADFVGIERRFHLRGEMAGIRVVDDYAHHPSELQATITAARAAHSGRVIAVFQPHRYTRTRDCFDAFTKCFDSADELLLTPIYPAGENAIAGIGAPELAAAIQASGHPSARAFDDFDAVLDALVTTLREDDLVLTLGAGTISSLGPQILERLGNHNS